MRGPPTARDRDRPALVSLEALVPADHVYRHLDATLDLGFVRDWVQDRYAARGVGPLPRVAGQGAGRHAGRCGGHGRRRCAARVPRR